ncbi:putative exonuclease and endonuclease [Scheffersomyces amazonensis]|uniref:putative exonuclease and endonuclease n=1 Tax=Scheffersomyces amazonensis TaxID=1078765 RepID=UPI00315DF0F1
MFKSILRNISHKTMSENVWRPRYFDIGVNFSDSMFNGYYHGSSEPKHPRDIGKVIERAHLFNVDKMLITASSIKETEDHFHLCEQYPHNFNSTGGVHPCTVAQEFYQKQSGNHHYSEELREDVNEKLLKLQNLIEEGYNKGYLKAFGEIGLDYDRFHYSSKHQQITMFKKQLEIYSNLKHLKLPLFLHMRSACDDFISIIKPFIDDGSIEFGNGVIHSFTGTIEELEKLKKLGFYFGVNGCSLKTDDNLVVAAKIPIEKLMIETDAPWCEVRRSHASYKYLTAYPNKFYPELDTTLQISESDVSLNSNKKKQSDIKLDDLLPFPSIKKENFHKHSAIVQSLLENHATPETIEYRIGKFAHPFIKSRNEPVNVGQVAQILCALHDLKTDEQIEKFIDIVYENSCKLFKV